MSTEAIAEEGAMHVQVKAEPNHADAPVHAAEESGALLHAEDAQTIVKEEHADDPLPKLDAASAVKQDEEPVKVETHDMPPLDTTSAPHVPSALLDASVLAAAAAEEASRKRRSRWSAPVAVEAVLAPVGGENASDDAPRKKSRWSAPAPVVEQSPHDRAMAMLSPEQVESFKIQLRIDELSRGMLNPADGLREREAENERERQSLVEALQRANPSYKAPAGFKRIRHERRLHIPLKEHPDYNFIGMIIGPRGRTQQRMEKESGCKIVIRGKGSQKEGRAQQRPMPGDDDELHVLIAGDNEAAVIATAKEVEKLLVPIDETKNEHKARQLRELAVINGTLRDEVICRLCGRPGHLQIQCPDRNQSWAPANVRCAICNSDLHPTADCSQRHHRTADQAAREMNDNYSAFMDELTGDGPMPTRTQQPLMLTDGENRSAPGGGGGGPPHGGGGGDYGRNPHGGGGGPDSGGFRRDGPPGGGYDRSAASANAQYQRDGGSRVVQGTTETFREYRPANAAAIASSAALQSVSARDGFRDAPQHHQQHQYGQHGQQHHYGGPPQPQYPSHHHEGHHQQHHYNHGPPPQQWNSGPQYPPARPAAPWVSSSSGPRGFDAHNFNLPPPPPRHY
jgi:hypothetical protein